MLFIASGGVKRRHSGTGKKIFTTNNHYEWSKYQSCRICHILKTSVYIIMQEFIVTQNVIIVVQVIL